MKKHNFDKGMAALLCAFPDRKFDCNIFWTFLSDLKDDEFLKSIADIISTKSELYPGTNVIALIREKGKLKEDMTAGEAWAICLREIRRVGSYDYPKSLDPLIEKVISIMGWRDLCLSDNMIADRAHFMKIYDNLVIRKRSEAMLLPEPRLKILIDQTKEKP
jgi:hypothetical protein